MLKGRDIPRSENLIFTKLRIVFKFIEHLMKHRHLELRNTDPNAPIRIEFLFHEACQTVYKLKKLTGSYKNRITIEELNWMTFYKVCQHYYVSSKTDGCCLCSCNHDVEQYVTEARRSGYHERQRTLHKFRRS